MDEREKLERMLLEGIREGRWTIDQIPEDIRKQFGIDDRTNPSFKERLLSPIGQAEQVLHGLGEVLPTAVLGASRGLEALGLDEKGGGSDWLESLLDRRREETAPDQQGEGMARFLGRAAGEGALGAVAGAPARAAGMAARGAGLLGDVATGVAVAGAGPEESMMGAIEALTGSETAGKLAENPLTRILAEVGGVLGMDAALRAGGNFLHGRMQSADRGLREAADQRGIGPRHEARRQRVYEIDQELNTLARSEVEVTGSSRNYNGELRDLRKGEGKLKTNGLTKEQRDRWQSLTLERKALIEDAVPEGLETRTVDPEVLAEGKGVWVRSTKETVDPSIRERAAQAYGKRQSVFRSDIKNDMGLWDRVLHQYMNWVDVDKPNDWLAEGLGLDPSMDPSRLARVRRRVDSWALRNWTDGLRTFGLDETPQTMSPQKVIEDFAGGDVEGLGYAMMALREQELRGRRMGKRLTDEQLQSGLDFYHSNSGIRQAVAFFQDYSEKWLKMLESEGLIPTGGADRIRAEGNYWFAPFKRADIDKMNKRLFGSNIPTMSDPLKKMERIGHEKGERIMYENPVVAWAEYTFSMSRAVARKRLHKSIAAIGDLGEEISAQGEKVRAKGLIRKIVPEDLPKNVDPSTSGSGLFDDLAPDVMDDQLMQAKDGTYYFRFVKKDGKADYYEVDKFLYESLRDTEGVQLSENILLRTLIAPGRMLRTGVTVTPNFAAANMWRDSIFRAMTDPNLGANHPDSGVAAVADAFGGGLRAVDNLFRDALHKVGADVPWVKAIAEDPNMRAMDLSGGSMSTLADMDEDSIIKVMDDMRRKMPGYASKLYRLSRIGRELHHDMKVFGAIGENTNRLDTFSRVRKDMMARGYGELDANIEAAYRAGEATVDFSRKGRLFETSKLVKTLDAGTAFWRAAIQGWDRTVRQVVDIDRHGVRVQDAKQLRQTAVVGATLTSMALLNYAYNRTNPDYFDVKKDIRSRYVLFDLGRTGGYVEQAVQGLIGEEVDMPILQQGSSLFLKVPVPHELGWLFATGPIRMLEELDSENPFHSDKTGIVDAFRQGFDPIGESLGSLIGPVNPLDPSFGGTGFGTFYQIKTNQDLFRDMPIEPPYARDLPADLRGRGTESFGAQALSEGMMKAGLPARSPGQIDLAVRGLGGGLASFGLDVVGMADPTREAHSVTQSAPLRRFFVDDRSKGAAGEAFYNEYFDLKAKIDASRSYEDRGQMDRAAQILGEIEPIDLARYQVMEVMYDNLRQMNVAQQNILNNEDLSDDDKRDLNTAIRAEAELLLKSGTYTSEEDWQALLRRDENPERRVLVRSLLEYFEDEKKKNTKIRRDIK